MNASNQKKELKKQEKKDREAFKKAFKKQTGVDADSKNWSKLLAAFSHQVDELSKWSALLAEAQPAELESARKRLDFWVDKDAALQAAAKDDEKTAGIAARDQLPTLLTAIQAIRKKAKNKPIKQQVDDREVGVFLTDIPGFAEMTRKQRVSAVKAAAQKTARGLEIYDQVMSGDIDVDGPDRDTTAEDAEALIWGLKSKAQEKLGGAYQKGAMSVPNGEKLRKYLDKCPEVYSRLSSHLREQQGRNVKGGKGVDDTEGQTPRGIDFYNPDGDDQPGSLPAGMNALLFQQMVLPNGEKALFIKMETEGSYGHPGDNRDIDSTVPPDRQEHKNDGARARKHLKNLLIKETGSEDKDLPGLREQTPKEIVATAKEVVKAIEGKSAKAYVKGSFGTEVKWGVLGSAVPRVSLFLDAVAKCRQHDGEDGWALGEEAEALLDRLTLEIQQKFPADLLQSDRRLGEEIVLTETDLTAPVQEQQPDDLNIDDESESDDDGNLSTAQLSLWCSQLIDEVSDPDLKAQLEELYYEEVLPIQDRDAFQTFSKVVGKSAVMELGPRASKIADQLLPRLDQL